jgi:hypothetical protein
VPVYVPADVADTQFGESFNVQLPVLVDVLVIAADHDPE